MRRCRIYSLKTTKHGLKIEDVNQLKTDDDCGLKDLILLR
jgi:hypothetical protein